LTPSAAGRILAFVMARRLGSLLLTAVLALAGLTVGPCPDGRCAMTAAKAMSCCQRDGLTKPSCCPPVEHLSQQVVPPAAERPAQMVACVAGQPLAGAIATLAPAPLDPAPTAARGAPPPGTLIAQHTSLLV
jgi:hypothetical protein